MIKGTSLYLRACFSSSSAREARHSEFALFVFHLDRKRRLLLYIAAVIVILLALLIIFPGRLVVSDLTALTVLLAIAALFLFASVAIFAFFAEFLGNKLLPKLQDDEKIRQRSLVLGTFFFVLSFLMQMTLTFTH